MKINYRKTTTKKGWVLYKSNPLPEFYIDITREKNRNNGTPEQTSWKLLFRAKGLLYFCRGFKRKKDAEKRVVEIFAGQPIFCAKGHLWKFNGQKMKKLQWYCLKRFGILNII